MKTTDKTPPESTVEEDLSAEEKVMRHEEAKRLEALKAGDGKSADTLPKVHTDDV